MLAERSALLYFVCTFKNNYFLPSELFVLLLFFSSSKNRTSFFCLFPDNFKNNRDALKIKINCSNIWQITKLLRLTIRRLFFPTKLFPSTSQSTSRLFSFSFRHNQMTENIDNPTLTPPASINSQSTVKSSLHPSSNIRRKWWKESIAYQIYPRSFQDSNGDGIGDLRGRCLHQRKESKQLKSFVFQEWFNDLIISKISVLISFGFVLYSKVQMM